MLEQIRKKFILYVKQFDLKDKNIMGKFHHSFRVMEYCSEIASSLKLNEEDITLAKIIGLLHDIGRFEQYTKYQTFSDIDSIDHADLGVSILKDQKIIEDKIILTAIQNHNKYQIEDHLEDKTLLLSKIIRDADKLDILKEQGNILTKPVTKLNKDILKSFQEEKLTNNKYYQTEADGILRSLSFIYDFHFKYSYQFIVKNKIIENKINLLENYSNEFDLLEILQNKLLTYVKERCE